MALKTIQEQVTAQYLDGVYVSAYSLSHSPILTTCTLYINGVFQRQVLDYNIANATITTLTLIPVSYDATVSYQYDDGWGPVPQFTDCQGAPTVLPQWHRGSTTLNSSVTSYDKVVDRIKYQLGHPVTRIELCNDQIYDFIDQACEWYTKYAGTTEEYMMFDSSQYVCGVGIQLDEVLTKISKYYCVCGTGTAAMSAQFIDCDLQDYRKVVGVFSLDPVESTGTDTLFTMDYLFAQQAYYSYLLGSFGFDMITWHVLKDWLKTREKMFATRPYFTFDPRTQRLKLFPEPLMPNQQFVGILGVHVERPIRDLVKERWVQRYALALSKIALGHIRGKFGSVTLFGGATIQGSDLMRQGEAEKEALEKELMENYGEVTPPLFFHWVFPFIFGLGCLLS